MVGKQQKHHREVARTYCSQCIIEDGTIAIHVGAKEASKPI